MGLNILFWLGNTDLRWTLAIFSQYCFQGIYSSEFLFHRFFHSLNIITSNVIQTISRLHKIILNTVLLWKNNTLYISAFSFLWAHPAVPWCVMCWSRAQRWSDRTAPAACCRGWSACLSDSRSQCRSYCAPRSSAGKHTSHLKRIIGVWFYF